ncbi:MAG: ribonucleotide-diphosphate reductase subunit beta [Pseudolysinimonas sp.]
MTGPFDTYAVSTDTASINGYEVPVDPMDDLQCESCQ